MILLAPIVLYLIWNFVVAIAFPGLFTLTFFQCFSITLLLTFIKAIFINKKSNDQKIKENDINMAKKQNTTKEPVELTQKIDFTEWLKKQEATFRSKVYKEHKKSKPVKQGFFS